MLTIPSGIAPAPGVRTETIYPGTGGLSQVVELCGENELPFPVLPSQRRCQSKNSRSL
jgi:hypothetical protein